VVNYKASSAVATAMAGTPTHKIKLAINDLTWLELFFSFNGLVSAAYD